MWNWTWIGGAIGAIALLLLKIWIEQEIKERGWPGLTRKLGNIGFIAMIAYSLLMAAFVAACVMYHYSYGMPQSFFWPTPRDVIWFEGATIPWMVALSLFYFRKNVMMFLAGVAEWMWGFFHLYVIFSHEAAGGRASLNLFNSKPGGVCR